MQWQYSIASSTSPWVEPKLEDKLGELGSNPSTTILQQELISLSICTCSNMLDVYLTTNSEAMVEGKLQEEGNQFKNKCQSICTKIQKKFMNKWSLQNIFVPSQWILDCWWRAYLGIEAQTLTAKSVNEWAQLPNELKTELGWYSGTRDG